MKINLWIIFACFFGQIFIQFLAVLFNLSSLPLLIMPILIFYTINKCNPLTALILANINGLIIDILSATPLGVNMFASTILVLFSSFIIHWFLKSSFLFLWAIFFGFSICYRMLLNIAFLLTAGVYNGTGFISLIFWSIVESIIAATVYYWLFGEKSNSHHTINSKITISDAYDC